MTNTETNTEQNTKTQIGARIDPNVAAVIEQIATEEERTTSSVVDRLLKSHPRVAEILDAQPAAATAGN